VLVQPLEEKEVKKGDIIIPDTAKEKPRLLMSHLSHNWFLQMTGGKEIICGISRVAKRNLVRFIIDP
jgi:hypothetical protein